MLRIHPRSVGVVAVSVGVGAASVAGVAASVGVGAASVAGVARECCGHRVLSPQIS